MRIVPQHKITNFLMGLDAGDIFKYDANYYVAGDIILSAGYRECFNLSQNHVSNIYHNPVVEYWHGDDAILKLCDEVK